MSRTCLVVVGILAVAGLAFGGNNPRWMKLDEALRASAMTGKPVCVYNNRVVAGGGG